MNLLVEKTERGVLPLRRGAGVYDFSFFERGGRDEIAGRQTLLSGGLHNLCCLLFRVIRKDSFPHGAV